MRPHDALYHYGVKGMKWGVRKQFAGVYDRVHAIERRSQEKQRARKLAKIAKIMQRKRMTEAEATRYHDRLTAAMKGEAVGYLLAQGISQYVLGGQAGIIDMTIAASMGSSAGKYLYDVTHQ